MYQQPVNNQAASAYVYQQNSQASAPHTVNNSQSIPHSQIGQNMLNRSYEGSQIQPKLHNAQMVGGVGGRSHSGGLNGPNTATSGTIPASNHPNNALQNSGEGRRKISINYSTQLPNNNQVQNQNQILNSGNYGHNTHQIIINSQNNNQLVGARGQKFQQHHRKTSQSSKPNQNQ